LAEEVSNAWYTNTLFSFSQASIAATSVSSMEIVAKSNWNESWKHKTLKP
jgi:hypothetical protein